MAKYVEACLVRKKLTTESAKKAFDTINALGPRWVLDEDRSDDIYLSPTIESRNISGYCLRTLGSGCAGTFDQAVNNTLKEMLKVTMQDGRNLVVNGNTDKRVEFTFDRDKNDFVPYRS